MGIRHSLTSIWRRLRSPASDEELAVLRALAWRYERFPGQGVTPGEIVGVANSKLAVALTDRGTYAVLRDLIARGLVDQGETRDHYRINENGLRFLGDRKGRIDRLRRKVQEPVYQPDYRTADELLRGAIHIRVVEPPKSRWKRAVWWAVVAVATAVVTLIVTDAYRKTTTTIWPIVMPITTSTSDSLGSKSNSRIESPPR